MTSTSFQPRTAGGQLSGEQTHFEARLPRSRRFVAVHDLLSRPLADYYLVMVSTGLLVGLGCLMVLSASSVWSAVHTDDPYYFIVRQLIFLALGLPFAFLASRLKPQTLMLLSWVAFLGSVALLLAVFTPLGQDNYGNRSWLRLGPIGTIQPAEFAKFALIIWAAAIFANRTRTLNQPRRLLLPVLPGFAIVLGLVLAGHDLGTALIIGVIMFAVLWFVGAPMRILLGLAAAGLAGVSLLVITDPERMSRIFSFLGNNPDPNASDQPINAIYALASGGWWGVGLGGSRQKWGGLYNGAQTDYVLAVLGEEMGLIGTLAVIVLFALLAYAGLRIALRSTEPFFRYAAAGMTAWISLQAVLNMAVVMRLLPVFGVPLPFLSQGGSALLANLFAVGVLLAAARHEPAAQAVLKATKQAKHPRLTSVVDARG